MLCFELLPNTGQMYFQKIFQLYIVIFICSTIIFQRYFAGLKLGLLSQYMHISFVIFHIIRLLMMQIIVYMLIFFLSE